MAENGEPTSLAARISKPEETESKSAPTDTTDPANSTAADVDATKQNENPKDSTLAKAQTDGAVAELNGATGIYEPEYDVDVKLSDVQADPNNPLYSIKTFDELGL